MHVVTHVARAPNALPVTPISMQSATGHGWALGHGGLCRAPQRTGFTPLNVEGMSVTLFLVV